MWGRSHEGTEGEGRREGVGADEETEGASERNIERSKPEDGRSISKGSLYLIVGMQVQRPQVVNEK